MRHIELPSLMATIFGDADGKKAKKALAAARRTCRGRGKKARKLYIDRNGSRKWSPIKERITAILGHKCWYTEVELVGADLTIDHFRPKADYWWLAFEETNFRVACWWSNSPKYNAERGHVGGKGDAFPLLHPGVRALCRRDLAVEKPIILDPCNQHDCELLAFQSDGRPVLHPAFAADSVAKERVDRSQILLNLDHPDFNSKREQLYHQIADDVATYEELDEGSPSRIKIADRMRARITDNASFSTAARFYLKLHRHLDWVEALLNGG